MTTPEELIAEYADKINNACHGCPTTAEYLREFAALVRLDEADRIAQIRREVDRRMEKP